MQSGFQQVQPHCCSLERRHGLGRTTFEQRDLLTKAPQLLEVSCCISRGCQRSLVLSIEREILAHVEHTATDNASQHERMILSENAILVKMDSTIQKQLSSHTDRGYLQQKSSCDEKDAKTISAQ